MTDSLLLTHDRRGVGRITLNRPEVHNAFNEDLINALDEAIDTLACNAAVRVVVMAGNGKSFSAGADLNWMKRTADYDFAENSIDALRFGEMLGRFASMPKPVVGAIQGPAYGGGVGLVAACDIVIASEAAAFMLSEVKLGLIPAMISPYVVRAIGARQARRYFLSAERIDPATACVLGLVHEVVADGELEATVDAMVTRLLKNSPAAMAASKDLIYAVSDRPTDRAVIKDTAQRIAEARASADGREGIAAFLEKRKPVWPEQG